MPSRDHRFAITAPISKIITENVTYTLNDSVLIATGGSSGTTLASRRGVIVTGRRSSLEAGATISPWGYF